MKKKITKLILSTILTTVIVSLTIPSSSVASAGTKKQSPKAISQDQPIQIESDRVTFLQDSGQIIYQGHVIVHTGDKTLFAEEVTVNRNAQQKITSILATGQPAKFSAPMQNSTELLHAHAQNIDYDPSLSLLILTGKARLKHQQDTFEGPVLRYTLNEHKIEAVTANNQRPKMVIMPKNGGS
tara:strand:- start:15355 stop:15903 length:549 start_codon:yes stop_codon:yes gene_type:complete